MEQGFDGPRIETVSSPKKWRSSYNPVALTTLEKTTKKTASVEEAQSKKETLGRYLDAIDTEVADNFQVFESQEHPGVRFSHTSISVRKVTSLAQNHPISPEQDPALGEKLTYVLFTPFSPPPGGDADDVMNAVYDRVCAVLPDLKNNPGQDITLHVLGLPTSKWGSVSEEWVRNLEKGIEEKQDSANGFAQHGSLYAEFLRTVLGKNPIMFYGSSMGSILASETARKLSEIWNHLRVLVDVPTGTHKPPFITINHFPLSLRGMQIMAGFGIELRMRSWFDNLVKTSFAGKDRAREELTNILRERGMIPHDSAEETMLKKAAFINEIKLLIRGTPFDTDDFRSYVVQGMLDPATINLKRVWSLITGKKFFKAGERSLGMGINYTHWMDRGRWLNKWVRNIEYYEKKAKKF